MSTNLRPDEIDRLNDIVAILLADGMVVSRAEFVRLAVVDALDVAEQQMGGRSNVLLRARGVPPVPDAGRGKGNFIYHLLEGRQDTDVQKKGKR